VKGLKTVTRSPANKSHKSALKIAQRFNAGSRWDFIFLSPNEGQQKSLSLQRLSILALLLSSLRDSPFLLNVTQC